MSPRPVLQEPAAAGDPAHRRSQVAPEEEPERLPERTACGALRFAAAQPRVVRGHPGLFAIVVPPDHVRGDGEALEILGPQLRPRDEPPTDRRTRHPTTDARTSRGLALLDRPRPSASRYARAGATSPLSAAIGRCRSTICGSCSMSATHAPHGGWELATEPCTAPRSRRPRPRSARAAPAERAPRRCAPHAIRLRKAWSSPSNRATTVGRSPSSTMRAERR